MKTWIRLTLFGLLSCQFTPAWGGEFFYTLDPFEMEKSPGDSANPSQRTARAVLQATATTPQRLRSTSENPVQPASYCSETVAAPRYAKPACPPQQLRHQPACPPSQPCPGEVRAKEAVVRRVPASVRRTPAAVRRSQGVFTAPRAVGEVSGPSQSIGFRGFAIHFPAFRLELPTIQLPSCFRWRRDSEMRLTESVASYTEEEPVLYGQLMTQREVVRETPVVRRRVVEQSEPAGVRSAPAEICQPPQPENRTQSEMLRKLMKQCQPNPPSEPRAKVQQPMACNSIEELNQAYRTRLQQLILERQQQIEKAKRDLELLKMQQNLIPEDTEQNFDTAPPYAPAPAADDEPK